MNKPQPAARPPVRDRLTNDATIATLKGERRDNKRFNKPGRPESSFNAAPFTCTQHKLLRLKSYSCLPVNSKPKTPFKLARLERYSTSPPTALINPKPAKPKSYSDSLVNNGVKAASGLRRRKRFSGNTNSDLLNEPERLRISRNLDSGSRGLERQAQDPFFIILVKLAYDSYGLENLGES